MLNAIEAFAEVHPFMASFIVSVMALFVYMVVTALPVFLPHPEQDARLNTQRNDAEDKGAPGGEA